MKLLVFGATGGTGFQVVRQGLEKGYQVTAFVRNPEKLKITNPNLSVVKGDVLQQQSIENALIGHDAVICCLGVPANKAGTLRSVGTANIINSMQKMGIKRLICQTSLGFDDSLEVLNNTSFFFKNLIVPYILKTTFAEHSVQEQNIKNSSLNWTIVRPGNLTDGKLTESYKHGFDYNDKSIKVKVSRADVADFLLKQVDSTQYFQKISGISY